MKVQGDHTTKIATGRVQRHMEKEKHGKPRKMPQPYNIVPAAAQHIHHMKEYQDWPYTRRSGLQGTQRRVDLQLWQT
jgi:hypothetical protein